MKSSWHPRKGGEFMYPKPYTILPLLVGLWLAIIALAPSSTFAETRPANLVTVQGATKEFQTRDWDGRLVEVEIPSQSFRDIQTSNGSPRGSGMTGPTDKTVPVTVVAMDTQRHIVNVRTQYGQTLTLNMDTTGMQIGETLTLVVPW
jgi:hypothetical protein